MSAAIHTLVQFVDGKPSTAMGVWGHSKTRSFTRKGSAENYRNEVIRHVEFLNERYKRTDPIPDIRILTVQIPDDGELKDGLYPGLLAVPAVSWS